MEYAECDSEKYLGNQTMQSLVLLAVMPSLDSVNSCVTHFESQLDHGDLRAGSAYMAVEGPPRPSPK